MSNFLLVYFSGTGGTEMVAESFGKELSKRQHTVNMLPLDYSKVDFCGADAQHLAQNADMIILLFAVHAMDAPDPVYEWIEHTIAGNDKKVAVISVAGGGEMWPNTQCRVNCNKTLENKGFDVVYEKMMAMPANVIVAPEDHGTMHLINVLPEKVNKILDSLLAGKRRRTTRHKGFIISFLSKGEKTGAKYFANSFLVKDSCTGCGWCVKHCPRGNIELQNSRPSFKDKCIICTRCVYGCPSNALSSKSFMIFKKGFNIQDIQRRMKDTELKPIKKCFKGITWLGVRRYLFDKDGY